MQTKKTETIIIGEDTFISGYGTFTAGSYRVTMPEDYDADEVTASDIVWDGEVYTASPSDETTQSVRDAVAEAYGQWVDCCWTHELIVDGHSVIDGNGEAELCSGGTAGCGYCEQANQAAIDAAYAASHVISYWNQGEPLMALQAAREAVAEEITYGESPVYGPLMHTVESAIRGMSNIDAEWADAHAEAVESV